LEEFHKINSSRAFGDNYELSSKVKVTTRPNMVIQGPGTHTHCWLPVEFCLVHRPDVLNWHWVWGNSWFHC